MSLQLSGQIKFSDISLQFLGVSNVQTKLGTYYTNSTSIFTKGVIGLPVIGNSIKFSNFYSKSCILGSIVFTAIGNNSWTVPDGVNMISVACIGGGGGATIAGSTTGCRSIGGGGGGALAYINKIRVTPRSIFTITVGNNSLTTTTNSPVAGGDSFITTDTGNIIVRAGGGKPGGYISTGSANSTLGGDGGIVLVGFGGNGGKGQDVGNYTQGYATYGGGGGAGGYTGNGGAGGVGNGEGGGGGGGSIGQSIYTNSSVGAATSGGGTAIFGIDNNGFASSGPNILGYNGSVNKSSGLIAYGAGAGGRASGIIWSGQGVVRIIFGTITSFPYTNEYSTLPTILSNGSSAALTKNGTYYYYIFSSTSMGTNSINIRSPINCSILVVGGGGGGGGGFGGSGGGGGSVNYKASYILNIGIYTIIVGAGGAGGRCYYNNSSGLGGLQGGQSKIIFNGIDLIVANGGGGSDSATSSVNYHPVNGGSSSANINEHIINYSGGNGYFDSSQFRWVSGGGAGAGGNGVSGLMTGNTLNSYGNGGIGYTSSITQTSVIYAGGGAGAPAAAGVTNEDAGINGPGQENFGGGGRGYSNDNDPGQNGKGGCVIIAFTFP
jgi:hypothetical protein